MKQLLLLGILASLIGACTKQEQCTPNTITNTIYIDSNASIFKLCGNTWKLDSTSLNHQHPVIVASYTESFKTDGEFNFDCPNYIPSHINTTYCLAGDTIKFINKLSPEGGFDYVILSLNNTNMHYFITNGTMLYKEYWLTKQ